MKTIWTLTGLCLLVSAPAWAFDPFARELDSVEAGNNSYTEQHFDQALDKYEQAEQEVEQEPRVHFNRGAALFKLGRPKEAREAYLRASGLDDPGMKKQNYYNIGNTFLAEGAFHDAIPYYRRALEIDPGFDDARYNLELVLAAIKQQQQQQQDQQSDQQDQKDQKDQQENQDQKKDEQQKDEKKEGDQDQGQDQKEQEDKKPGDQKDQKEQEKDQQQEQQDQQDQQGQQDQQDQQDQKDQKGQKDQRDQKEQEKGQQAQKQPGQQDQQGDKEEQKQQEQQSGQPKPQPQKIPGQLSQAEFRDLLDSMRDSEKPFQMHKFELPEYRQQQTEKDW
jgi:Ca-activated chloride channel family protein